ncbi:hypothetical protein AB9P05_01350 [Roseivirga sp. BDSF3-8]|uniref:hypothetical protein n=1 Tax=Roseivirga sp. BDSF3-8 TaxID=3241598 RepID=UPI0035326B15
MKIIKPLICVIFLFVSACESDPPESNAQPKADIPLTRGEELIIWKIQKMEQAMHEVWPSFDMTEFPAYIILETPTPKGYFVNSPVFTDEAYKIEYSEGNMDFYRNDDYVEEIDSAFDPRRFYTFYYKIDGVDHMILRPYQSTNDYYEYKDFEDNFFPYYLYS